MKEEAYQLTPKGALRVITMQYMTEEQFEKVWAEFEAFMSRREAAQAGEGGR